MQTRARERLDMERRQMGMERSGRRKDRQKEKAGRECRGREEERRSPNGERENVLDRQSKFKREEVTEESMQTKEVEG